VFGGVAAAVVVTADTGATTATGSGVTGTGDAGRSPVGDLGPDIEAVDVTVVAVAVIAVGESEVFRPSDENGATKQIGRDDVAIGDDVAASAAEDDDASTDNADAAEDVSNVGAGVDSDAALERVGEGAVEMEERPRKRKREDDCETREPPRSPPTCC